MTPATAATKTIVGSQRFMAVLSLHGTRGILRGAGPRASDHPGADGGRAPRRAFCCRMRGGCPGLASLRAAAAGGDGEGARAHRLAHVQCAQRELLLPRA